MDALKVVQEVTSCDLPGVVEDHQDLIRGFLFLWGFGMREDSFELDQCFFLKLGVHANVDFDVCLRIFQLSLLHGLDG